MAVKGIETVISLVDKTAAPFVLFNKRVEGALRPIHKLEHSLKRLDRVSGLRMLRSGFKEFGANAKNALQSFTNFGTSIGLVFGAAGFAVAKLNKSILKLSDLEGRASLYGLKNVGVLQQIEYAANIAGVSIDSIGNSLTKMMLKSLNDKDGVFKSVGLDAKKISEGKISVTDAIVSLSDKFKNANYSAAQKLDISKALFGESGKEMIGLLDEGGETLQKWFDEREKIGLMNGGDADKAKEYAKSLNKLKVTFNALVQSVGVKFLPKMTELVTNLSDEFSKNSGVYLEAFDKLSQSLPKFIDSAIKNMPKFFKAIGHFFNFIEKIINRTGVAVPTIVVAFGGIVVPLIGIITSVCKILWMPLKIILSFVNIFCSGIAKMLKHLPKFITGIKTVGLSFKGVIPAVKRFGIALKGALGPLGWGLLVVEELMPLIKAVCVEWDNLKFGNFDETIESLNKIGDIFANWLENLTLIGPFFKLLRGLSVNKVDFSGIGGDDIGSLMMEAENPESGMRKSGLFQSVTKNVNRNTNNNIDISLHGFPQGMTVTRKGPVFDDSTLYGNNMVSVF